MKTKKNTPAWVLAHKGDIAGSEKALAQSRTPTPWGHMANVITGNEAREVIGTLTDTGAHDSVANAAFIVRAVNSHEELLEYIKFIHKGNHDTIDCASCRLIAKAEGK